MLFLYINLTKFIKMKKTLLSLVVLLTVVFTGNAQEKHLPASKNIVGVWNQLIVLPTGQKVTTGNYKVINADNTFYTMIVWALNGRKDKPSTIGLYGTYSIDTDSTYTEHIVESGVNPKMSNTNSQLKYKMLDENTLLIQFKNEATGKWMPEIWIRVQLHNSDKKEISII